MAEEIQKACHALANCDRKFKDHIKEMRKIVQTADEKDKVRQLHGHIEFLNRDIQAMDYQIKSLTREKELLMKEYLALQIASENSLSESISGKIDYV